MSVEDFVKLIGTRDSKGHMIVTQQFLGRYWRFSIDVEDVDETLRMAFYDDWMYVAYRTSDDVIIIIKHHCIVSGVKDEPDFLVTLPSSGLGEEFQTSVWFERDQVFVMNHLIEGSEESVKPLYFKWVDMTNGSVYDLCCLDKSEEDMMDYESFIAFLNCMWLDGPFFHVYSGIDELVIVVDVKSGDVKFYVTFTELADHLCNIRVRDNYVWWYDDLVLDMVSKKYHCFEGNTSNSVCGILDGKVHWWTFPSARAISDKQRLDFGESAQVLSA